MSPAQFLAKNCAIEQPEGITRPHWIEIALNEEYRNRSTDLFDYQAQIPIELVPRVKSYLIRVLPSGDLDHNVYKSDHKDGKGITMSRRPDGWTLRTGAFFHSRDILIAAASRTLQILPKSSILRLCPTEVP